MIPVLQLCHTSSKEALPEASSNKHYQPLYTSSLSPHPYPLIKKKKKSTFILSPRATYIRPNHQCHFEVVFALRPLHWALFSHRGVLSPREMLVVTQTGDFLKACQSWQLSQRFRHLVLHWRGSHSSRGFAKFMSPIRATSESGGASWLRTSLPHGREVEKGWTSTPFTLPWTGKSDVATEGWQPTNWDVPYYEISQRIKVHKGSQSQ